MSRITGLATGLDVDAVVKGVSGGNLPSTIISLCDKEPVVVRQGGLLVVRY